jgi:hypothetical protein
MEARVHRRQFLRQGLAFAGGALFLPFGKFALSAAGVGKSDPVADVLHLIATFGRNASYVGATVAAVLGGRTPVVTSLRAEIDDFGAFANAFGSWRAFDLEQVRAASSTFTVVVANRIFEIEALPAGDFASAAAGNARDAIFAHDALALAPGSNQAVDPLRAGNTLRLLRSSTGAAALADVLRGRIDAAESGLVPDASFLEAESRVLAGSVVDANAADQLARTFFTHVTALADALPAAQMKALAASPLISSAVQARLGVSTLRIVHENLQSARARNVQASAAAAWLAAGLSSEIKAGRGERWIATESMGRMMAATAALEEAQALVTSSIRGPTRAQISPNGGNNLNSGAQHPPPVTGGNADH